MRTLAVSLLLVATFALLIGPAYDREADAHLVNAPLPAVSLKLTRAELHARQTRNLFHAKYVCEKGRGKTKRWHCNAAYGWLLREWTESKPPLTNIQAIYAVFGQYGSQALDVAICESDYYPRDGVPDTHAVNGQYLGMFQMGENERATYGHSSTAIGQARAAYRYFADVGFHWGPWECKP